MKERLKEHFEMKDMGSAWLPLGVEVRKRHEEGYFMVQEKLGS